MTADWDGRRLHFVGLGGAGMSGLALVAAALGAEVTGSDRADSPYLERVRAAGIAPVVGHDAANVPDGDDVELVVSTAIPASNPERAVAAARGLREIHRGALLGELSRLRRTISIGGTHGKTTTASMAAHALLALGWDPSYVIGGELTTTGTNAAAGTGEWLVVEADESDRSFLELSSEVAVVTNIELDHHATYGSVEELERAFCGFLRNGLRRVVADTIEGEAFLDRVGIVEAGVLRGIRGRAARGRLALCLGGCRGRAGGARGAQRRERRRRADGLRHRGGAAEGARRDARGLPRGGAALRARRAVRGRGARRRRLRPSPDRAARDDRRGADARVRAGRRRVPAAPVLADASTGAGVRGGAGDR